MGVFFIVNPTASRGNSIKKWKRFSAALDKSGIKYDEAYTTKPKEATSLAKKAAEEGFTEIFSVGGDGTLLEVANGLVGSNAAMGVIPFGAGNDFVKSVKVPFSIPELIELVRNKPRKRIDMGCLNGFIFCNILSAGFDAEAAAAAENVLKGVGGTLAYVLGVFKTLASFKAPQMALHIDGELIEKKGLLVAVGNGCYYGGGMKILPQANPYDGLLDICFADDIGRLKLLSFLPGIYSGSHVNMPEVHFYRAKKIKIECDPPMIVQADGEILTQTPIEIEILPRCIDFICNP